MDYGFTHNGKVYTPNGTTVDATENDTRNAAIAEAELAHWATCPERMGAYYAFPNEQTAGRPYRATFYPSNTGAKITTWTGALLGHIVSARVYRHNFGSRMVSMRVRGTNGAMYYGRASWDNGECVTLHKAKG